MTAVRRRGARHGCKRKRLESQAASGKYSFSFHANHSCEKKKNDFNTWRTSASSRQAHGFVLLDFCIGVDILNKPVKPLENRFRFLENSYPRPAASNHTPPACKWGNAESRFSKSWRAYTSGNGMFPRLACRHCCSIARRGYLQAAPWLTLDRGVVLDRTLA